MYIAVYQCIHIQQKEKSVCPHRLWENWSFIAYYNTSLKAQRLSIFSHYYSDRVSKRFCGTTASFASSINACRRRSRATITLSSFRRSLEDLGRFNVFDEPDCIPANSVAVLREFSARIIRPSEARTRDNRRRKYLRSIMLPVCPAR